MKELAKGLIRFYQRQISPCKPPSCRFYPSCSGYALTAIDRFGFCKGSLLAIWRILRCNPYNKGGYDPVPENWKDAFRRRGKAKREGSAGNHSDFTSAP